MNLLIDIEGPSAVGKTTLIKRFEKEGVGTGSKEVLDIARPPIIEPQKQDEFLMKQIWFFEQAMNRYEFSSSSGITFIDLGFLDCLLHTRYYSSFRNNNWDITNIFKKLIIQKYEKSRISDFVIFLQADKHTLRARKKSDPDRSRSNHEENLELYKKKKNFYYRLAEQYPDYVCIINAEQSINEVYSQALNQIETLKKTKITNYNSKPMAGPTLEGIFQLLYEKEE